MAKLEVTDEYDMTQKIEKNVDLLDDINERWAREGKVSVVDMLSVLTSMREEIRALKNK